MEKPLKIVMLILCIVLLTLSIEIVVKEYSQQSELQEKLEAGLEECPIRPNSGYTLWVRSCKEYSEISKDYKPSTKGK
jgi:hypothetical protein